MRGGRKVEGPWFALTAKDRADIARRHDSADRHDLQAPARDAAELAEYERIERDRQAAAEWEERDIHIHGRHSADQEIEHDDRCIYSCPYDTPQQAACLAELATRAVLFARAYDDTARILVRDLQEMEAGE